MNLANAKLEQVNSANISVIGMLGFANVAELRQQGLSVISAAGSKLTFDFSKVSCNDSSGLALLTAWSRYAHQQGKAIHFSNLPNTLIVVAKLSNLDKILGL